MAVARAHFILRFEMGWRSLSQTAPPSESLMYFIPFDAYRMTTLWTLVAAHILVPFRESP
jgi:hypothetical protein